MGTVAAGALIASGTASAAAKTKRPSKTRVEGPVTGGKRGRLFGGFAGDALEKAGYVEEEYFVSGTAQEWKAVGELAQDGRWKVAPDKTGAYKTRVIVHRPRDPAKFNGIVMCEWTNVSAFLEISNAINETFYEAGYAFAAISAQRAGLEGFEGQTSGENVGLKHWDAERYGALNIPGDGLSYDIFTQVARALADPASRTGVDPMSGLKVRHCIAHGESQSAARLAAYINAIHPVTNFFSGFIPCVLVGGASELYSSDIIPGESRMDWSKRFNSRIVPTTIRDDLKTPILVMISETEARGHRVPPQPDSEWLRMWEIAGAVHGSAVDVGYRDDTSQRDGYRDMMSGSTARMVRFMPTMAAAGLAMIRWLEGGEPLVRQPRLLRGRSLRETVVDADGNALGGVRLPEMLVPTAQFETKSSPAMGVRKPFTPERLRELYPTDELYFNEMRAAVDACLVSDLILPYRAAQYLEEAQKGALAQG